jgi:hypothetical protein
MLVAWPVSELRSCPLLERLESIFAKFDAVISGEKGQNASICLVLRVQKGRF